VFGKILEIYSLHFFIAIPKKEIFRFSEKINGLIYINLKGE
jgi:hypothetical protein